MSILNRETRGAQLFADLDRARFYLRVLAVMCSEAATATDPRVVAVALGVLALQGRELSS